MGNLVIGSLVNPELYANGDNSKVPLSVGEISRASTLRTAKVAAISLYASRILRPIWELPIIYIKDPSSNEYRIGGLVNDAQRVFIQQKLNELRVFIKDNYDFLIRFDKKLEHKPIPLLTIGGTSTLNFYPNREFQAQKEYNDNICDMIVREKVNIFISEKKYLIEMALLIESG